MEIESEMEEKKIDTENWSIGGDGITINGSRAKLNVKKVYNSVYGENEISRGGCKWGVNFEGKKASSLAIGVASNTEKRNDYFDSKEICSIGYRCDGNVWVKTDKIKKEFKCGDGYDMNDKIEIELDFTKDKNFVVINFYKNGEIIPNNDLYQNLLPHNSYRLAATMYKKSTQVVIQKSSRYIPQIKHIKDALQSFIPNFQNVQELINEIDNEQVINLLNGSVNISGDRQEVEQHFTESILAIQSAQNNFSRVFQLEYHRHDHCDDDDDDDQVSKDPQQRIIALESKILSLERECEKLKCGKKELEDGLSVLELDHLDLSFEIPPIENDKKLTTEQKNLHEWIKNKEAILKEWNANFEHIKRFKINLELELEKKEKNIYGSHLETIQEEYLELFNDKSKMNEEISLIIDEMIAKRSKIQTLLHEYESQNSNDKKSIEQLRYEFNETDEIRKDLMEKLKEIKIKYNNSVATQNDLDRKIKSKQYDESVSKSRLIQAQETNNLYSKDLANINDIDSESDEIMDEIKEFVQELCSIFESNWYNWDSKSILVWINYVNNGGFLHLIEDIKSNLHEKPISGRSLQEFTENDLTSLGVKRFDVRRQLFRCIQDLIKQYPLKDTTEGTEPGDSDFPKHLCCPLTGKIMSNPVQATDGVTYEKTAIQRYLEEHDHISPITHQRIDSLFFKNRVIEKEIVAFNDSSTIS